MPVIPSIVVGTVLFGAIVFLLFLGLRFIFLAGREASSSLSRIVHRRNWYLARVHPGAPAVEVTCSACEGRGVQWLHPGEGWGPIPKDLLIVNKQSRTFRSPLANTRTCINCQGRQTVRIPVDNLEVL